MFLPSDRIITSRRRLHRCAAIAAIIPLALVGWPVGAGATDGQPVIAGVQNLETQTTQIWNTSSSVTACPLGGTYALSACGAIGVGGTGDSYGVVGYAKAGDGVLAVSSTNDGVVGTTAGSAANGVAGQNTGAGNGVFGDTNSATASGVYGHNSGAGFGVAGRAAGGIGALGDSANGVGVWANSDNATALKVTGKAQFSRSGVVSITGTTTTPRFAVSVALPLTAKSMVTATLERYFPGVWVVAAVPNTPVAGRFTIYLNKSVTTTVGPIGWIVSERP
jgi:hypothetical protein